MIWLHIFRITNHETSVSENTFDMCVPKNNKVHFWKKKHWYCEIFKNLNRQLQSMYGIYFMLLAIFRLAYHFLQNHCSWHKKNIINKYKVAKGPRRLKTKQKWRAKEPKSKSISGDLRLNFTGTMHYHHEALELFDNKTHGLTQGWPFNLMVLHRQPKNHWKKLRY